MFTINYMVVQGQLLKSMWLWLLTYPNETFKWHIYSKNCAKSFWNLSINKEVIVVLTNRDVRTHRCIHKCTHACTQSVMVVRWLCLAHCKWPREKSSPINNALIQFILIHSLIIHFGTFPNSKKLQATTEMWLLKRL